MLFKEWGNKNAPVIMLLHGGGLSWWSWISVIKALETDYRIITPILDGHGEAGRETFKSIEDSAGKIINYIDKNRGGHIYAIGGLSMGAQIAAEVLAERENIADYAILESALIYPLWGSRLSAIIANALSYGLIRNRYFSRLRAKKLFVPESMFERYYSDSLYMSRKTLINMTGCSRNYRFKKGLAGTKARVLILVGEKEKRMIKKSARTLHKNISNSEYVMVSQMGPGKLSLAHWEEYVKKIKAFFAG